GTPACRTGRPRKEQSSTPRVWPRFRGDRSHPRETASPAWERPVGEPGERARPRSAVDPWPPYYRTSPGVSAPMTALARSPLKPGKRRTCLRGMTSMDRPLERKETAMRPRFPALALLLGMTAALVGCAATNYEQSSYSADYESDADYGYFYDALSPYGAWYQ